MLGYKDADNGPSVAMVNKPFPASSRSLRDLESAEKDMLRCTHCNGTRHTKDACFESHGYPEWFLELRKQIKGKSSKRPAQTRKADPDPGFSCNGSSLQ